MARILDSIDSPDKLKLLTDEELSILAQEIREEIINVTSKTGGHVASSLGAVEIILAVHSLIDSPHDRFLFDVGHQSYAHMLITGRLNEFPTLRQYKGLRKASVVPGTDWLTMIAFMSGSSDRLTMHWMVVSSSSVKLSG